MFTHVIVDLSEFSRSNILFQKIGGLYPLERLGNLLQRSGIQNIHVVSQQQSELQGQFKDPSFIRWHSTLPQGLAGGVLIFKKIYFFDPRWFRDFLFNASAVSPLIFHPEASPNLFEINESTDFLLAEKWLLQRLSKATDGFIARHFDRKISLFCTRFLMNRSVSAHQMTLVVTFVGLLSGLITAWGTKIGIILGGILFNLSAILDGVDGELARLKMTESRLGEWLDTVSDNIALLAYFVGSIYALYHLHDPWFIPLTVLMGLGWLGVMGVMFIYLIKRGGSGSLVAVYQDFTKKGENSKNQVIRFFTKMGFMLRRDFFATAFMIMAFSGSLHPLFMSVITATHVAWMILLITLFGE